MRTYRPLRYAPFNDRNRHETPTTTKENVAQSRRKQSASRPFLVPAWKNKITNYIRRSSRLEAYQQTLRRGQERAAANHEQASNKHEREHVQLQGSGLRVNRSAFGLRGPGWVTCFTLSTRWKSGDETGGYGSSFKVARHKIGTTGHPTILSLHLFFSDWCCSQSSQKHRLCSLDFSNASLFISLFHLVLYVSFKRRSFFGLWAF